VITIKLECGERVLEVSAPEVDEAVAALDGALSKAEEFLAFGYGQWAPGSHRKVPDRPLARIPA
jgi:hypothetical protein